MLPHCITSQVPQHFFLWPWQTVLPGYPRELIASLSLYIFPFAACVRHKLCSLSRTCSCSLLTCHQSFSFVSSSPASDSPAVPSVSQSPPFQTEYSSAFSALPLVLNMPDLLSHLLHVPSQSWAGGVLESCLSLLRCLPAT